MTLAEFCKKRKEELGLTWNDIMDGGIAQYTFSMIASGKQLTMKPATMEKLARLLKCTMGDIQACMAETPNPLRKEAARPEGTAGISITAKAKKKPKPEAPAPDPKDEEPAEVFETDEPDVDMMFPESETEVEMDNRITREVAEECYKRKLKDKVGKILAGTHHELTDRVRQEIGVMLLQELWGESE